MQIQQCGIQGYVDLMIVNNNTTKYKKNCTEPNQNLYGYWIISDMNNSGKSMNPYKATDDAFLKSHFNNAKQDIFSCIVVSKNWVRGYMRKSKEYDGTFIDVAVGNNDRWAKKGIQNIAFASNGVVISDNNDLEVYELN